jgi:hypothetical protein
VNLILGDEEDAHAMHVLDALLQRGCDAHLIDSASFPQSFCLSMDPLDPARSTLRLEDGRVVNWSQVHSVYWRQYSEVLAPDLPDSEQNYIASNDARSLFESFLQCLPVRWVNGWAAFQMHQTKPVQLSAVGQMDLPPNLRVPKTYLGNDPNALREFVATVGACVFKPIQGGTHTRRVKPRHLTDENLQNLTTAPVTVQEEILGTDIRVFVAGERVLACSIQTQELDFRDDHDPQIVPVDLPDEIQSACRAIAQRLDLLWTGIDLRQMPDEDYVFFEANPSPMFMGFEQRSGLPLTEALLDLLVG